MNRERTIFETDRRGFLTAAGSAAIGLAASGAGLTGASQRAAKIRIGVDAYSLGAQNWTPFQTLDWASKLHVNMVHFSEVRFLGSPKWQEALAPDNLKRIRDRAAELTIDLEIGMRSICPTAADFQSAQKNDPTLGTADEQIARMVIAAKTIGSPIVRCVQGTQADRRTGLDQHIAETVKVVKQNRSRLVDAGVKLAIENHAGDMQGRELKGLIEAAGPDCIGACVDTGNAMWTIEDPAATLEALAPYALTSHFRDSYVFNSPQGIASQWTRMGDGNIGIADIIKTYVAKCPGKAVSLEVIVQGNWRVFNYRDPAAWDLFQSVPASSFARFLALAEKGAPKELPPPGAGRGGGNAGAGRGVQGPPGAAAGGGRGAPNPEAQARNLADVEASVKWTQDIIAHL
ncbi:MAG: TIM barrel protein [Vicinamibacterales bacterium]